MATTFPDLICRYRKHNIHRVELNKPGIHAWKSQTKTVSPQQKQKILKATREKEKVTYEQTTQHNRLNCNQRSRKWRLRKTSPPGAPSGWLSRPSPPGSRPRGSTSLTTPTLGLLSEVSVTSSASLCHHNSFIFCKPATCRHCAATCRWDCPRLQTWLARPSTVK